MEEKELTAEAVKRAMDCFFYGEWFTVEEIEEVMQNMSFSTSIESVYHRLGEIVSSPDTHPVKKAAFVGSGDLEWVLKILLNRWNFQKFLGAAVAPRKDEPYEGYIDVREKNYFERRVYGY